MKENLLWVRRFDTVVELRQALLAFRESYNSTWLIARHVFRTPNAVRHKQLPSAALAAYASNRCLRNRGRYTTVIHPPSSIGSLSRPKRR